MFGRKGDDRLYGEDGDDEITGDRDADLIFGGFGDDVLTGGFGKDRVFGGPGNDYLNIRGGLADFADCGPGRDRVRKDSRDRVRNCEIVVK
jgi:Ca2+-binding RTX toxin-like protein